MAKARVLIPVVAVALLAIGLYLKLVTPRGASDPFKLRTPNKIEEGSFVEIGGIRQWLQIRGENRDNPILLFVHGGPGASALILASVWRPWEKYFTVVQWDQRGSGRTYHENGDSEAAQMTIERMAQDGIEVAEYLQKHLKKPKIVLMGHSWGSILGVHMVMRRPDLFSAYVGTGQGVNLQRGDAVNYSHVMGRAIAAKNTKAVAELTKIGPPPYRDTSKYEAEERWAAKLAPRLGDAPMARMGSLPPGMSELDRIYILRGYKFSGDHFAKTLSSFDLESLGFNFSIPVFFFMGTEDQMTPMELVADYYSKIHAPHKELVRFEGDHHFVLFNRPGEFLAELIARVRPFAVKSR